MQTRQYFIQAMLQATAHRTGTVFQPLTEHGLKIFDLRATIKTDHVHVDAIVLLEVSRRKQVRHHCGGINPVGLRHDHQAGWILVV